MEQSENKSRQSHFDRLDTTAKEITIALTRNQCRHGFIGGYAASLVGGARTTEVRPLNIFSILDAITQADLN